MTDDEKRRLKSLIVTTNLYYGKQMDDAVILMQVADLEDLLFMHVARAFQEYRRNPLNRSAPLPASIRAAIVPELSGDQLAIEASNKIIEAMGKFGYTNPEKAREFMGELAWEVVVRDGGWRDLCQRTNHNDLPVMRAQWRELAKVVRVRQEQAAPSLPFLEGTKHKELK